MSSVRVVTADAAPTGKRAAPVRVVLLDASGPALKSAKKKEWAALEPRWKRLDGSHKPASMVTIDSEPNVLVLSVGETDDDWFAAGATLGRSMSTNAVLNVNGTIPESFIEGVILGGNKFSKKSDPKAKATYTLTVVGSAGFERAVTIADATCVARELANTPSNVKSPVWLAKQAERIGAAAGLRVTRLSKAELTQFGGLQAVSAGSKFGPELLTLAYKPSAPSEEHIVLVGKGITFDSGGLSLKPADAMMMMKTDMSGAAAVLGVMSAVKALGVPVNVTGVIAIAENMPGANAMRPGDVITHYSGRTTEVLNTDAEGRLVLADAIGYAQKRLNPDVIIDIATLTGAATLALGRGRGAMFSNSDRLASSLIKASQRSRDSLWHLPLERDYAFGIESSIADAANSGTDHKVGGGAITAALFLEPFAGGCTWAHLDIAGPARNEKERSATGFGVRLLLDWLVNRA